MKLCTYKIKRIAKPSEDLIHQWEIEIVFTPNWFERNFLGRYLPRRKLLVGSLDHWAWKTPWRSGGVYRPASVLWRMWAQHRIKLYQERHKHDKSIAD